MLITSLPFVHTARRSYRLNDPVRPPDCGNAAGSPAAMPREAVQTLSFRGRRSRNKVSVGEPAEGSLSKPAQQNDPRTRFKHRGRRSLVARLPPSPEARKLFGRPTNPGAESAKEYYNRQPSPSRPVRGSCGGKRAALLTQTTLGNGYLGSRIDEERSEMRYLV